MNLERVLKKPEYFLNPRQLWRRLMQKSGLVNHGSSAKLPWYEGEFSVEPQETIGKSILTFGFYDLVVTETIYRLGNPRGIAIDIGANIGYFTTLMAKCFADVHAFEPHPEVFARLQKNTRQCPKLTLYPQALSQTSGTTALYIPEGFAQNQGIASLNKFADAREVVVDTTTLDHCFPEQAIELLKIDVEGHELKVFQGGQGVLSRTQHIIFEDFAGSDSPCIRFLAEQGFTIFRLNKGYFDLELLPPQADASLPRWEPPNYLATRNAEQIKAHNSWQIFKI